MKDQDIDRLSDLVYQITNVKTWPGDPNWIRLLTAALQKGLDAVLAIRVPAPAAVVEEPPKPVVKPDRISSWMKK